MCPEFIDNGEKFLKIFINFFNYIGSSALALVDRAGGVSVMFIHMVTSIFKPPFRLKLIIKQMEFIGYKSVPVVILTGAFTGMVFGLQSYIGFKNFGAEAMTGSIVAMAMIRELGPTLSAIMVAARAGSAITAEIGTMKVTEQIDALYALAVDPIHYLGVPRLVAAMITVPLLNGICILFGLLGGYFVNVVLMGVNGTVYFENTILYSNGRDILDSMIKAMVFGMIIAAVSCFNGFRTKMGAEGVGKATTTAVVEACVLILMFDYIITSLLVP